MSKIAYVLLVLLVLLIFVSTSAKEIAKENIVALSKGQAIICADTFKSEIIEKDYLITKDNLSIVSATSTKYNLWLDCDILLKNKK